MDEKKVRDALRKGIAKVVATIGIENDLAFEVDEKGLRLMLPAKGQFADVKALRIDIEETWW